MVQSVIEHPRDAHSLLNWALVLQYIRGEYEEAEQFFLRALDAAPSVSARSCGALSWHLTALIVPPVVLAWTTRSCGLAWLGLAWLGLAVADV